MLLHGFKTRGLLLGVIAVSILCLPANTASAQEAADVQPPVVTVVTATANEVVGRIPFSGTLVPREEVLVNPQVNGHGIETINVEIGDKVSAGDVLIELDDDTLAAQLAQADAELLRAEAAQRQAANQIESAKAKLVQAQAVLDRSRELRASGNISQATLDQNIASQTSASAALASAEDGLSVAQAQLQQATSQRDLARVNR